MKRVLFFVFASLLATFATSQTLTTKWVLYDVAGGPALGNDTTQALCRTRAKTLNVTKVYTCRAEDAVVAKPPPVVVPPNPFPAGESQTVACTPPTVGSWVQTRTYTYVAASNSWVAGDYSPVTAPAGACTTPPTSLLPFVDKTKIAAPATGWGTDLIADTTDFGDNTPGRTDGDFREGCVFSHFNFDDVLVFPGQPGVSHAHVYAGNVGANANSTPGSIATTGNSTCAGGKLNRSAYWSPAMIDTTDGTPIVPSGLLVYYKTGYGGVLSKDIQPLPAGLRFISGSSAGNPTTPSTAGRFTCVGGTLGVGWQKTIPTTCQQYNQLIMEVSFPQCWDGKNLDSPDHKSHMAEATGKGCPSTHPVALPKIDFEWYYDLAKVDLKRMAKWRLSSDNYAATSPGGYSVHGDYMLGWDVDTMKTFVTKCVNANVDCHANLLGNGKTLYIPDKSAAGLKSMAGK